MGCSGGDSCTHGRAARVQQWDRARGNSSERGYGSRWRKFVSWFVSELFRLNVPRAGLCGSRLTGARETTDSECQKQGLVVRGTVADHIDPVSSPNDPRFFVATELQWLCDSCHNSKRQRERRRVEGVGGIPTSASIASATAARSFTHTVSK